jgi:hypothetical protein
MILQVINFIIFEESIKEKNFKILWKKDHFSSKTFLINAFKKRSNQIRNFLKILRFLYLFIGFHLLLIFEMYYSMRFIVGTFIDISTNLFPRLFGSI